jgi:hypothetical protein
MPIRKYIPGATFDPEAIKVMVSAFEGARTILNLSDANDPLVEIVAKKVVSLVSEGTTDPDEIQRLIISDADVIAAERT